jgi:hypothetical protein
MSKIYTDNPYGLLIRNDNERDDATHSIKNSIKDFRLSVKDALNQLVWELSECNKDHVDAGITDTATREAIAEKAAGIHPDGSGDIRFSDMIEDALYEVR